MIRNDFAVMIISHGRADNVLTVKTLRRNGYTGRIYLVVDDQDDQADRYRENFGAENVLVFSKEEMYWKCDSMENAHNMRAALYARIACFELARKVGLKYLLQLDDDYTGFYFRWISGDVLRAAECHKLDDPFSAALDFLIASDADCVAFAQDGDYVGGISSTAASVPLLRKTMNTFFCRTDRPLKFSGVMNDDVNMYVPGTLRGRLLFTLTSFAIVQPLTQAVPGGMSEVYKDCGTYLKTFSTVMMAPAFVKVSMLRGGKAGAEHQHWRIHHHVRWENCAPKILSEKWRKAKGRRK